MAERTGYSRLQIGLHWLIGILIIVNYFLGEGMGRLLRQKVEGEAVSPSPHVIIGMLVLVLVVVRLIVRLRQGAPAAGGVPGSLQQRAAGWGHALLYVLMVSVPLGGAIMWFGGIEALGDGHAIAGNVLMILAGGHALVALYHQYVVKDGLLRRMMKAG